MNRHAQPLEHRTLFASLPSGFSERTIASGLDAPTTMAYAPDGRLFVAEQGGALRVIRSSKLIDRPFARFNVDDDGERGLLGIAFDPDYLKNHYVYVYYTVPGDGDRPTHNRVSRLVANGDRAVRGTERVVLELSRLSSATNHNGGTIGFGPDRKLYIATGDNARQPNSQDLNTLHGKILRVFPNGRIPKDNPFREKTKGVNEAIWAIGLRNPFNFAFDRPNGRMFINDVGSQTWEEINEGRAGAHYGWPETEGPTNNKRYRAPLYAYRHGVGPETGEAIVGAAFYSPAKRTFPSDYAGDYFFADLASGWIRRYDVASKRVSGFASGITLPVGLAVAPDGALMYLARNDAEAAGTVVRVQTNR